MLSQQLKPLFIFWLVCTTINAGPAYPACAAACVQMCLLSVFFYAACVTPCLLGCVASCFSQDTLVTKLVNQKVVQVHISTIQIGDFVLTKSGFSRVTNNQKISEPIYFQRITFDDNSFIEVTPDHPILNENWSAVNQLQKGMLLERKTITNIQPILKDQRFFITTESGTITINGCEFGAFVFFDQNYEKAHREWIALFK